MSRRLPGHAPSQALEPDCRPSRYGGACSPRAVSAGSTEGEPEPDLSPTLRHHLAQPQLDPQSELDVEISPGAVPTPSIPWMPSRRSGRALGLRRSWVVATAVFAGDHRPDRRPGSRRYPRVGLFHVGRSRAPAADRCAPRATEQHQPPRRRRCTPLGVSGAVAVSAVDGRTAAVPLARRDGCRLTSTRSLPSAPGADAVRCTRPTLSESRSLLGIIVGSRRGVRFAFLRRLPGRVAASPWRASVDVTLASRACSSCLDRGGSTSIPPGPHALGFVAGGVGVRQAETRAAQASVAIDVLSQQLRC